MSIDRSIFHHQIIIVRLSYHDVDVYMYEDVRVRVSLYLHSTEREWNCRFVYFVLFFSRFYSDRNESSFAEHLFHCRACYSSSIDRQTLIFPCVNRDRLSIVLTDPDMFTMSMILGGEELHVGYTHTRQSKINKTKDIPNVIRRRIEIYLCLKEDQRHSVLFYTPLVC